jgi:hypothetical protein
MTDPTFSHPRFDPTFNFGHIMMVAGSVASVLAMFIGLVWWQSNFQTKVDIELGVNAKARNDYIPIIHDIVRIQAVTNSQISSLANSSGVLQGINKEQDEALASIRERLAAIEARLKVYGVGNIK